MRQKLYGCPPFKRRVVKDNTLRVTLSRLKARGLVTNNNGVWGITQSGRTFCEIVLKNRERRKLAKANRAKGKGMIIAFDVPEHERYKRDWLREELIVLGFEPIQKSVWYGPFPLPKKFIGEMGNKGVLACTKFFKAKPEDIV